MKIGRLLKIFRDGSIRGHFSQYGEDVILHKLFKKSYTNGFYIDVGAHHPFRQSNTAYLWLQGWNGINVDASKAAIKIFNRVRPNDFNIWSAVVDDDTALSQSEITLHYNLDVDLGATCDQTIAVQRNTRHSTLVPCTSLTKIINENIDKHKGSVDLLNIDIEGLDADVLRGIHKWKALPKVICTEIYSSDIEDALNSHISKTLRSAGYKMTNRTGLTSIFQRLPAD